MASLVLESIIHNFSPEEFIHFFRAKNRSFKPFDENALQYNDENFTDALYIGEIPFDSIERLIIYTFKVDKDLTERSGKKAQYEKGKRILRKQQADAGIFIFYDSDGRFRFSLIHTTYTGTRRQWSSFKRFTYFVSPDEHNKTFLQRIGDGDFSSLETIKEAFSVEKVTKEFYQEIANWYFWALKEVKFPYDAEAEPNGRNISLIRLITRLIFIWFMRQKGIVKRELFDIRFLKDILKDLSPEIDLIDLILGRRFYNLDYNEIVHILNYDFEIRGGNKLEQPFIFLVDKILAITKDEDYLDNSTNQAGVKEYERQIDEMVYKLYDLTEEEIRIVEESK